LSVKDGCAPTAMNNRLAALERMGLATSRRYGRIRFYRAV
jgi:DNA-binding transcriptional ArsR family regulator